MANRPDPHDLAYYSYILAITSSGLLLLVFVVSLAARAAAIPALGILINLIWLVIPSSSIGLALALMARADFRQQEPGKEWTNKVRVGFRINALALAFMLLWTIVIVLVRVLGLGG